MLTLQPVSLAEANAFVTLHHRHHKPVRGHKYSLSCFTGGQLVGVAITGRPVSRYLDDGLTLEVNRLYTDGTRNACSFRLWRGGAGGEGHGIPKDHHLHPGYGGRGQPPGGGLVLCRACRREGMDGETQARRTPVPGANEISL